MYLLILSEELDALGIHYNLHSIMYLLILDTWENGNIDKVIYIP